jgi:hypothetical protein
MFAFAWLKASFDRALHTLKKYQEKVEYINRKPIRAGLVKQAGEWKRSSQHNEGV